jgi:NAD(P)-dependent dehydrogenase (short-subunit alcohol dehydrogenase family)
MDQPSRFRPLPRSVVFGLLSLLVVTLVVTAAGAILEPGARGDHSGTEQIVGAPDRPVVLVTGSTAGLGRELALELASRGAHVIVHGRNEERGREVLETIQDQGGGSASFYPADLASLDQVRELARIIEAEYPRLDLLVNNAGVGPGAPGHERVITEDGHELRFQVNYLSGFLLTRMLLPLMQASAPARIVNVASRSQRELDFQDLRFDQGYSGSLAYGRSKLAQILFTVDLAEELRDSGVQVFAVHPAPAMDTELVRETGGRPQSTVAAGLKSVLQAIHTQDFESGTYFHELEAAQAHEQAYDRQARERLRALSEEFTGAPPLPSSLRR